MNMLPDYGLRRLREGFTSKIRMYFHGFWIDSFDVLGDGQFSVTVNMPIANEDHALSMDFDRQLLEAILAKAPEDVAEFVRAELHRDESSPRMIQLPCRIDFGVRARLGELQFSGTEQFVPLIAEEIM